ncbi:MAG: hypothetical protein PUJ55_08945 [Clostridiales bacterium]|nr:hypothetical protein [Roseburia sp.]MDD7637051.1 hypothetical protein [Clostridiales bacterium]MDY4111215.1 hypothetical protein [Roseburia sp.]
MKYIVEIFSVLLMLAWNTFLCIGILDVSADVAAAKEYKAAVVSEIENSNFNPHVMEGCIQEAAKRGYILEITTCMYGGDENLQMAEVCLTYDYEIPVLGIDGQKVTRGIAR